MLIERAREIAEFLGIHEADAIAKLSRGFGELHNDVTADFKRANPQTDAELLEWYRNTKAYIWELTAYHLDPGFNYSGMCEGIAVRLKSDGMNRVLCLGDGVGDLSLTIHAAGLEAWYHDLLNSRTSQFAEYRRHKAGLLRACMSPGWRFPNVEPRKCDAIVSLDFLEHVSDVDHWARAIYACLRPGGLLMAQNAFGCGSGPDGAIPMHLSRNDIYVTQWDPLLNAVGFIQESSNWYRKPL